MKERKKERKRVDKLRWGEETVKHWSIVYDKTDELKLTEYVDNTYENDMEITRSITECAIIVGIDPVKRK